MTTEADLETLEMLRRCYSGIVYDTMRDAGLTGYTLPASLRPIFESASVTGPAFTYQGAKPANLAVEDTVEEWTKLLSQAPAGAVLVCQANDDNVAHMGELSGETLKARGVKGVVIDGGCRDVRFLQDFEFAVWCRYYTPEDIVGRWIPIGIGEPITIGDTTIHTGDYVIADLDGVVIVPQKHAHQIALAATEAIDTEDLVRARLAKGEDPHQTYLKYGKF